jgi:hypothetical protein
MNQPELTSAEAAETVEAPVTTQPQPAFSRRELPENVNAGAVTIEAERAIAEAQGALVIAKKFPRDQGLAFARIMDACRRPSFAKAALYAYPRQGQTISGPSIRLAEELARCWGNLNFGTRELSRKDGASEMEAYCWDLETNTKSAQQFTVQHVRDTRQGRKALTDERDVYEVTANSGGRRLRARILAIIPQDIVEEAVAQCRATMEGDTTEPLANRVRKMVMAFDRLGVPAALIQRRLGHPIDATTSEEFAELLSIHNSIKDGLTKVSEWFGDAERDQQADDITAKLRGTGKAQS